MARAGLAPALYIKVRGWGAGLALAQTFPWTPALSCSPIRIQNRCGHVLLHTKFIHSFIHSSALIQKSQGEDLAAPRLDHGLRVAVTGVTRAGAALPQSVEDPDL